MLHLIDCDFVYLCCHGSSSCCLGLIVTLFICVLMVLSCCIGLIVTVFVRVLKVLPHDVLE